MFLRMPDVEDAAGKKSLKHFFQSRAAIGERDLLFRIVPDGTFQLCRSTRCDRPVDEAPRRASPSRKIPPNTALDAAAGDRRRARVADCRSCRRKSCVRPRARRPVLVGARPWRRVARTIAVDRRSTQSRRYQYARTSSASLKANSPPECQPAFNRPDFPPTIETLTPIPPSGA